MVPHLIKAQSAYKNIRIHLLHTPRGMCAHTPRQTHTPRHHHPLHTHTHIHAHTHTQSFVYMQQYYIQLSVSTVWVHNVSVILKPVII